MTRQEARIREAAKLGFSHAYLPKKRNNRVVHTDMSMALTEIGHVAELLATLQTETSSKHGAMARHG